MDVLATLKEPLTGYEVRLATIPASDLEVIQVQRKPSQPHVKRLSASIRRIGFVVPLIVVERRGGNWVIDGQHRFLAGKAAGVKAFPCVVIPERFAHNLMELNVEKQMNLREKCHVALNVYRMILKEEPKIAENDGRILDSIEHAYFVTVGLAYEKTPRLSGSAFEPLLKKVDPWTDLPLERALGERQRRAGVLLAAHEAVQACVGALKRIGLTHPFIYKEIVSYANPHKRKRKIDDDFDGLFRKLGAALEELRDKPEKMRRHKFGAGEG
jgi:ParB family chromosome partitioning protein